MPKKRKSLEEQAREQTAQRYAAMRSQAARKGWETRYKRGESVGPVGERYLASLPADWWEHEAPLHDDIGEAGDRDYPGAE